MSYLNSQYMIYKLSTGESFIAENKVDEIKENHSKFIEFKNPLYVSFNPTQNGIQVGFLPWGELVYVNSDNIIAYNPPQDELEKQYIQLTTGIHLAH